MLVTFKRNRRGSYRASMGHLMLRKVKGGWRVMSGSTRERCVGSAAKLADAKVAAVNFLQSAGMDARWESGSVE
jgi:hypothetical protein